jgi:hypothetical protein
VLLYEAADDRVRDRLCVDLIFPAPDLLLECNKLHGGFSFPYRRHLAVPNPI